MILKPIVAAYLNPRMKTVKVIIPNIIVQVRIRMEWPCIVKKFLVDSISSDEDKESRYNLQDNDNTNIVWGNHDKERKDGEIISKVLNDELKDAR